MSGPAAPHPKDPDPTAPHPAGADWMRPLGGTGLHVSAVTLGGAPLGSMPTNFGHETSYDQGVAVVCSALDSPIRAIDTANGYSGGESERRIGAAVAAQGSLPADFVVMTKVDARDGDYTGERVRASIRESRERLGLDRLPLVFLHDPEYHDFAQLSAPGGAVETLFRLRDEGVVGHVGLAGGPVEEMNRYLDLGGFEALLVHNRWTLLDHSAGDLIQRADEEGIALLNAAIYGGGLIADPNGRTDYAYQPAPEPMLRAARAMSEACTARGLSLATAAVHASVQDRRVTSTVIGLSTPARLRTLLEALTTDVPADLLTELADLLPDRSHWLDHRAA